MKRTFDKQELTRRLEPLGVQRWVAFATACAERLIPIFRIGEEAWTWHGRTAAIEKMLEVCWRLALHPDDGTLRDQLLASDVHDLVSGADESDFSGYRLFVFPPMGTLKVAIGCARDQTVERAAQAAQKEFDAAFGIGDWGLPASKAWLGMTADESRESGAARLERLRNHPIVQNCLRTQHETVDQLASVDSLDERFLSSFQQRAKYDGDVFVKTAMEIYPRRES